LTTISYLRRACVHAPLSSQKSASRYQGFCGSRTHTLTYSQEGPTIEGDVSFLSEKEWRDEIDVLLSDLIDEDGTVKRATDLRSDAGIAWSKVCTHMLRRYLDN
jgi:hypothetical protein